MIEALERRAAQGLLSEQELEDRVRRARTALTHAGLDGILLDLAPAPTLAPTPTLEPPEPPTPQPAPPAPPPAGPPPASIEGPAYLPPTVGPWRMPTAAPPRRPLPEERPIHGPWRTPPPTRPRSPRGDRPPLWRRPTTYGLLGVVAVGALAIWVIAVRVDDLEPNEPIGSQAHVPASTTPQPPLPPTTERATTVPTTAPPPPPPPPTFPSMDPVLLRVGTDIQPGRYSITTSGEICYWERVHGLGGTLDDVIVNGGGPHPVVDVLASDAGLRSQGCGGWRPHAPPATPATSFGDGDWLVGSDVAPGTYRPNAPGVDPNFCMWEQASGFTHDYDEVIAYEFTRPATVTINAGERFTASGCGTWTRV